MSNFSPKLEDATEEELKYMVNELDFRVVPLASDELTRRTLSKLQETMEVANKHSEELESANYKLQLIMVVLTGIGTLMILLPIFKIISQWLSLIIKDLFEIQLISADLFSAIISLIVILIYVKIHKVKIKNIIKVLMP